MNPHKPVAIDQRGRTWWGGPLPIIGAIVALAGWALYSYAATTAWWETRYFYRSQVSVDTASGSALPAGYTVAVDVDHAQLVTNGQSRPDGLDVRVVYQGGASPVEISRVVEHPQTSAIWHFDEPKLGLALNYGAPPDGSPPVTGHFQFEPGSQLVSEYPAAGGSSLDNALVAPTQNGGAFASGKFGNAYRTTTSTQYLHFADDADFTPQTVGFAFEAWVYLESFSGAQTWIMEKYSGSERSYLLSLNASRQLTWQIRRTGEASDDIIQDDVPFTIQRWHYIVGIYDMSSCDIKLYVDGQLRGIRPAGACQAIRDSNATAPVRIGQGNAGATEPGFVGLIDEVAFWSRPLTEAEIADHWHRGASEDATLNAHTVQLHHMGSTGAGFSGAAGNLALDCQPAAKTTALIEDSPRFDVSSGLTIEFFLKPRGLAGTMGVVGQWAIGGQSWRFEQQANRIAFYADTNGAGGTEVSLLSSSLLTTNWQHVAVTWQGGTYTLYLNGTVAGSAAAGVPFNSTGPLLVGASNVVWTGASDLGLGVTPFDGWIDELAYHTRALPQPTLAAHALSGVPSTGWNLDQTRVLFKLSAPIAAGADNRDYYLYYGNLNNLTANAAAGLLEDGSARVDKPENVYLFYDDFSGGVNGFDTAKWNVSDNYTNSGWRGWGGGIHYLRGTSAYGWASGSDVIWSKLPFDANSRLEMRMLAVAQSSTTFFGYRGLSSSNIHAVGMQADGTGPTFLAQVSDAAADKLETSAPIQLGKFHLYAWARETGPARVQMFLDNSASALASTSDSTKISVQPLPISLRPIDTSSFLIDWVRVREWVTTPPATQVDFSTEQVVLWLDSGADQWISAGSTKDAAPITFRTKGAIMSGFDTPGQPPTNLSNLRIMIPSGIGGLRWANVGTIVPSGPQAAKISANLLPYEDGFRTAVIDVTSDFVGGNEVTISGLRFDASSMTTLYLPAQPDMRLGADTNNNDPGDGSLLDVFDETRLLIREGLRIVDPVGGQPANGLTNTGAPVPTDQALFKLTASTSGGSVTIKRLNFTAAFANGMAWTNVSKLELLEGATVIGTKLSPGNGDFSTVSDGNIEFDATDLANRTIGANSSKTYTVRATLTGLAAGHKMTVSLAASGAVEANGNDSPTTDLQNEVGGVTVATALSTGVAHQVPETLTLANSPVANNALTNSGTPVPAGKDLLAFTATAAGPAGGSTTLTRLNFTAAFANGMAWANVSKLELLEGATVIATKNSPTDANFTTLARTVSVGTPKTYTLRGDFTGLTAGHQLTASLTFTKGATANVEAYGATYGAPLVLQNVDNAISLTGAILKLHQVPETLTLASVAVGNALTNIGTPVPTAVPLLQVTATAAGPAGGRATLTAVKFTMAFANGMAWANVSKLELLEGATVIATKNNPTDADFTTAADGNVEMSLGNVAYRTIVVGTPRTYTLRGDFTGLAAGHQLTASLTFTKGATANVEAYGATYGAPLVLQNVDNAISLTGAILKLHQVPETLTLANVAVGNALTQSGTLLDKDILQLTGTAAGGDLTIERLNISITFTGSPLMSWANITKLELLEGVTVLSTKVNPVNADFTGLTSAITSAAPQTYTLRASFTNMQPGHQIDVNLSTSGVEADGTTSGTLDLQGVTNAISIAGGPISMTHVVRAYVLTAPVAGEMVVVGSRKWREGAFPLITPITWDSFGGADPSNVTVSYATVANPGPGDWTMLTCEVLSAGLCRAVVPDRVTPDFTQPNIRIRVLENIGSEPAEGFSALFNIGGIIDIQSIHEDNLPGGRTLLVGKTYQLEWRQAGTFDTLLQYFKDIAGLPQDILPPKTYTAPVETLFQEAFTPSMSDITGGVTAFVRARPVTSIATEGSRDSVNFIVTPAFLNLQPSGGEIIKSTDPIAITWERLDGTKPLSENPSSALPINTVAIKILDAGNGVVASFTAPNISPFGGWTPSQGATGLRVQICDASQLSVCAESAPFNVVDLAIAIAHFSPLPPGDNAALTSADFLVGIPAKLTWGAGLSAGARVHLMLQAQDGTVLLDTITNTPPPVTQSVPASDLQFSWTIPTTLNVPLQNVHIRLQKEGSPGVFAESAPFAMHGRIQNVTLSASPVQTEKATPPDVTNDVTVSWQAFGTMGANAFKLWLSRDDGTSYQPLETFDVGGSDANAVNGTSFVWTNISGAARTQTAKIKVTQQADEVFVMNESMGFAVQAQLASPIVVKNALGVNKPTFNVNDPSELPLRIEWQLARGPITNAVRVRVYDVDNANAVVFESQPANSATETIVQQEPWTPATPFSNLRAEVCDAADLAVCATSNLFAVGGITVLAPPAGQRVVIGAGGASIEPIQWRPATGSGSVKLEYTIAGGPPQLITAAVPSNNNVTNTYGDPLNPSDAAWTVPVTFTDLSDQVQVVVTDAAAGLSAQSASFTIAGTLMITSTQPAGPYEVDQPIDLFWNVYGGMTAAKLQYSTDGATWNDGPTVVPTDRQLLGWVIPQDAISQNLRLRLVDTSPGHPAADSPSYSIVVTPRLVLTMPDPAPWVPGQTHAIQWSATGLIDKVQLLYSVNGGPFTPMAGTPQANGIVCNGACDDNAGDPNWADSFDWQVVDEQLSRDPATYAPGTVAVKIVDASTGHVAIERPSSALAYIYYRIEWKVVDASSNSPLSGLQVDEQLPDATTWTNAPEYDLSGSQVRYYPAGANFHTAWFLPNNNGSSDYSQSQFESGPVQFWTSDRDQIRTVRIEVASAEAVTWAVKAGAQYFAASATRPTEQVEITTWLEKSGKIVEDQWVQGGVTQQNGAYAEIYEDGLLIRTLPVDPLLGVGQMPDGSGTFRLVWDLTRDDGSVVPDDKLYFVKTILYRLSRTFTSGVASDILIPKKILTGGGAGGGVTLTELQTELTPVKTDLGEIKSATVGAGSTLEQIRSIVTPLPQQLTDAQTAIQTDLATAKSELSTQIGDVKTDTAAIRIETDKIQGIQTYLEDPSAGLPAILSGQTELKDQARALRKGKLLNRETEIEQGETATFLYQPADAVTIPMIQLIGPSGSLGPSAMSPAGGGLYSYGQLFDATFTPGEYTVIVTEAPSSVSDGTVDTITLAVRVPAARTGDLTSITTKLDDLSTQLTNVETNLDGKLTAIQATMATSAQADGIQATVDQLIAKWGASTAQDLRDELAALSATIGTPTTGTIAGDIAAIPGMIDFTAQFTALQDAITAMQTAMGTPSQAAAVQAVADQVGTLQTDLTNLSTQVGDPAQRAQIDTVLARLDTIEQDMAKDVTVQTALGELAALQGAVAALSTQIGAPAQAAALQLVQDDVDALEALIFGLPGVLNYTTRFDDIDAQLDSIELIVSTMSGGPGGPGGGGDLATIEAQLTALTQDVTDLSTQVGDPAQRAQVDGIVAQLTAMDVAMAKDADVQAALGQLAALQTAVGNIPTTDYTAQMTALQNAMALLQAAVGTPAQAAALQGAITQLTALQADLTNLSTQVGDPAQRAQVDSVVTQLNSIQTAMAKDADLQTALAQLNGLDTALANLTTQVGTPAQAAALQLVQNGVDAIQADIAALPGATDYSPQFTALQNSVNAMTSAMGSPSQAAAVQAVADQIAALQATVAAIPPAADYSAQLASLQTDLTTLATQVSDPAQVAALQDVANQVAAVQAAIGSLPAGVDPTTQLTALQGALDGLKTDLASIPTTDHAAELASVQSALTTIQSGVSGLAAAGTEADTVGTSTTLLAKLDALQAMVETAEGSGAAVSASKSASAAAQEAVKILQQIQERVAAGQAGDGASLLAQLKGAMGNVSNQVTVINGKLNADELQAQLKQLTEQTKAISSEKGYAFDSLFETAEVQSDDLKAMRNRVEELKQLLEVQRALLERNLNQPVMKTWFEAQ